MFGYNPPSQRTPNYGGLDDDLLDAKPSNSIWDRLQLPEHTPASL